MGIVNGQVVQKDNKRVSWRVVSIAEYVAVLASSLVGGHGNISLPQIRLTVGKDASWSSSCLNRLQPAGKASKLAGCGQASGR